MSAPSAIDAAPTAPPETSGWCDELTTRYGVRLLIRPVGPDDETRLADFFEHVLPEEIKFRFLSPLKHVGHDLLARLAGVDHIWDEHFLAFAEDGDTLLASAMIVSTSDSCEAEVAIAVRSDHRHMGIGWTMLSYVAGLAERNGMRSIVSYESADNRETIALESEMGFTAGFCPDEPRLVLLRKALGDPRVDGHE